MNPIKVPRKVAEALTAICKSIKEDNTDALFVVCGKEGIGKSRTARLLGAYCAHELGTSFGVDNIHYSVDEYMKSCDHMGKNAVHILDEAGVILHRSSSASTDSKRFTRFLQVSREGLNAVHIIVLPAYHLLDGYVINWRTRFVLYMYPEIIQNPDGSTGLKRGAFKIFTDTKELARLWNLYRETKTFEYPKQYWAHDRMPDFEPFDPNQLNDLFEKKRDWRSKFIETKGESKKSFDTKVKLAKSLLDKGLIDGSAKSIAQMMDLDTSSSYRISRALRGEKIYYG